MPVRLCIFEDQSVVGLEPLALCRPAFDLWCGAMSLGERQRSHFGATEVALLVRPLLADLCRLTYPHATVNDPNWLRAETTVFVNARWLPPPAPAPDLAKPRLAHSDGQVAYAVLAPRQAAAGLRGAFRGCATCARAFPRRRHSGRDWRHPSPGD